MLAMRALVCFLLYGTCVGLAPESLGRDPVPTFVAGEHETNRKPDESGVWGKPKPLFRPTLSSPVIGDS